MSTDQIEREEYSEQPKRAPESAMAGTYHFEDDVLWLKEYVGWSIVKDLRKSPGPKKPAGDTGRHNGDVYPSKEAAIDDAIAATRPRGLDPDGPDYDAILLAARKRREAINSWEGIVPVRLANEPSTPDQLHRALSLWNPDPDRPAIRRAMLGGGE